MSNAIVVIGKHPVGASPDDKAALLKVCQQISPDAVIIPDNMSIVIEIVPREPDHPRLTDCVGFTVEVQE